MQGRTRWTLQSGQARSSRAAQPAPGRAGFQGVGGEEVQGASGPGGLAGSRWGQAETGCRHGGVVCQPQNVFTACVGFAQLALAPPPPHGQSPLLCPLDTCPGPRRAARAKHWGLLPAARQASLSALERAGAQGLSDQLPACGFRGVRVGQESVSTFLCQGSQMCWGAGLEAFAPIEPWPG